jgi:hypothetical protein
MAKRHFLRFLIRNRKDDLIFEVRSQEADRLQQTLDQANGTSHSCEFFWFDTVDGQSVVLNLLYVQAVRFLWEPVRNPPDLKISDGPVRIMLRDRSEPIEEYTEDFDLLYNMFTNLQYGPEIVAFSSFIDGDGELLQLNAKEVLWVVAPTHLLSEGASMIAKDEGLEDDT